MRSKAHWGYDAEFMRLCMPSLTVGEASITQGRVLVATDETGRAIGTVSVMQDGDAAELRSWEVFESAELPAHRGTRTVDDHRAHGPARAG